MLQENEANFTQMEPILDIEAIYKYAEAPNLSQGFYFMSVFWLILNYIMGITTNGAVIFTFIKEPLVNMCGMYLLTNNIHYFRKEHLSIRCYSIWFFRISSWDSLEFQSKSSLLQIRDGLWGMSLV